MKRPHFALPEIYDDSLSYYDVLRKLIKSMHVISDNLNKIPEQIANEAKARLLGDQNLQQNINAEASAREQADTTLQQNINTETSAREQGDQEIREGVTNKISELKGDIANSKEAIAELADKKITKFYANNLGETTLNDSDNGKIQDMLIFGKSLQDGTPTPDVPVEIHSVVNPTVKACGKNVLNPTIQTQTVNGVTITNNGDGTFTLNGTATESTWFYLIKNLELESGSYILVGCPNGGEINKYAMAIGSIYDTGNGAKFTVNEIKNFNVIIISYKGNTYNNLVFKPMITKDLNATYDDFEPYTEQTATLPYTLNAIPVSSGGNVTIDGKQYIADYVDIDNKKLVKMVDESKLDTTVSIVNNTDLLLETPTITDLTDEEVQAFKELTTYYPTTNLFVTSEQLDGYTTFNYQISMANGWNYVKEQLGDTREYIYDMDLQSAEAYVNSEYAVTLTELEV